MGNTIGFSARKWREETFGGEYINTPETALFKKSKIFFALFYSKKRMMRSRIACIVEGQLDALRLIEAGIFDHCSHRWHRLWPNPCGAAESHGG